MIPRIATYRLQFREGMTFDKAVDLIPYLQRLGVSHLYASPVFTAAPGSTHGYDIADFNEVEPGLGGLDGLCRLAAALRDAGMGLMLDIVPNHMAASPANHWWRDVAEWGRDATHARHFDIDSTRKLTLPVLGDTLDNVLADGDIRLRVDAECRGLVLAYHDHAYPLTPPSYGLLAAQDAATGVLTRLADRAAKASPQDAQDFHAAMREMLTEAGAAPTSALDAANADRAFLRRLHDAQPWEFTNWRDARHTLSYRRFFEVTGLVGTRVEDPVVFDDAHRLVLDLIRQGLVDGLRVDHVDGLADPAAYLRRLRDAAGQDCWIVVEKILEGAETLPPGWPVDGTTGYEFIAAMSDLLLAQRGSSAMQATYEDVTDTSPVAAQRETAKHRIVTHNFAGELSRVTELLLPFADGLDYRALQDALVALVVALPVYRTYGDVSGFSDTDRAMLEEAATLAADAADARALNVLLHALGHEDAAEGRIRFQQLSGPVMAKAVEDTLFYRHTAILAFNEVGCDPVTPPAGITAAHATLAARARRQPHALNATATHDTKRGEDARARLYTLAEWPDRWTSGVRRWREWHKGHVLGDAPEPATAWGLYQALAGVWPKAPPDAAALASLAERFTPYLVKALREAKLRTDWTNTDETYEERVCAYAAHMLDPGNARFIADFHDTLAPFIAAGEQRALSQLLLKLTAPGVPDIYQGSEGGDFSLVDPDNRRTPDWDRLDRLLTGAVWPPKADAAKSFVLSRAIAARRVDPELFAKGHYEPLTVTGAKAEAIFAFERRLGDNVAVTLAQVRSLPPSAEKGAFWGDTAISFSGNCPPLTSVFSGRRHQTGTLALADWLENSEHPLNVDLLASFPV